MHALFLDLVIGIRPCFICLVCISFDMKVAHLILWAIMHGNAWLLVRESRHMPLWVTNMIGSLISAYIAWIVLPCKFCPLLLWVAGSAGILCRPAIILLPIASFCAGDHIPLPVGILFSRWWTPVYREASLRLGQSSERQSRENRGRLCMAVHFRARPEHALHLALFPRRFTAFPSLISLTSWLGNL